MSVMAAPSGPDTTPKWPTTIRLVATPQGVRAFNIKLPAILGINLFTTYAAALDHFHASDSWEPGDEKTARLYEHIFNQFVPALEGHDDLLVRMNEECGTNGPQAINWLLQELDPSSKAASIQKVLRVFNTTVTDDNPLQPVQSMISMNSTLTKPFQLDPSLLSILIVSKFPASLSSLCEHIIQQDDVPKPTVLISKLKTSISFQSAAAAASPLSSDAAFIAAKPPYAPKPKVCINCESPLHVKESCDKPPTPCDVCGLFAGHTSQFCLIKNGRPFPDNWDERRKANMQAKRDQYKSRASLSTGAAAVVCLPISSSDGEFSDNFWEMMESTYPKA